MTKDLSILPDITNNYEACGQIKQENISLDVLASMGTSVAV